MSYKKKTEPGRTLNFCEAVEDIYHGYYVYLRDKPVHPGYMCSMSLQAISSLSSTWYFAYGFPVLIDKYCLT